MSSNSSGGGYRGQRGQVRPGRCGTPGRPNQGRHDGRGDAARGQRSSDYRGREQGMGGSGRGRGDVQGYRRRGGGGGRGGQRSQSPIRVNVCQFNETVVIQPVAKRAGLLASEETAVNLIVNHFAFNYEDIHCFHYDVEIKLKHRDGNGINNTGLQVQNDKRLENIEVIERLARDSPMFADVVHFFDGNKNFYTNRRLSDEFTREVTLTLDGYMEQTFVVNMTFVRELQMNVIKDLFEGRVQNPTLDMFSDDLQVLDIALAYRVKRTRVPVGRNLYSRTNREPIDGLNVEIGFGHHQSLGLTECGLTANVDRMATLFRSDGIVEMCEVYPHQAMPQSATTDAMQREIVGVSNSQSPLKRFDKIVASVEDIIHESQPLMSAFGLTLSTRPIKLVGRVLPAPTVRGDAIQLNNYLFINVSSIVVRNDVLEFWKGLVTTAIGMGIEITTASDGMPIHYTSAIDPDIEKLFIDGVKNDYQMIFVCLQDRRLNVVFEDYKHWDRVYGIVTQCIKDENLLNPRSGYYENILQKFRSRLDRLSLILDPTVRQQLFPKKLMIVGVDVVHPGTNPLSNERSISFIAALVGSYDPELTKFSANVSAQPMGAEIISNFDVLFGNALDHYMDRNGSYPQNVIVFRDGVSESQFQTVIDNELPLIAKAFGARGVTSKPKITVFVVQKRIHTRFIPYKVEKDWKGREITNINPGTVVDHTIVSPLFTEFFLCSHKAQLGTSRPTKYIVLRNDHSFSADSLQKIAYYMCYAYNRYSTPISIPIPLKYADLAAFRAKQHILSMSVEDQVNDSESAEEREERFARNIDAFNASLEVDPKMAFLPYYS